MNTLSYKKKGKGGRKTYFALLGLLLMCFSTSAQNFLSQSLLNVRSLATGTNGFGVTNLSGLVTNSGMVHATNVTWTNLSGTTIRSAGAASGTNTTTTFPLFRDVSLWVGRDGRPLYNLAANGGDTPISTTNYVLSPFNLYIELSSAYGSNAPIGINIAPVWDSDRTPTKTTDDWNIVIPGGTGYTTIATNVPIWRWPGAYGLRIRNITNQFLIAGDAGLTNTAYIHRLSLNGFRP